MQAALLQPQLLGRGAFRHSGAAPVTWTGSTVSITINGANQLQTMLGHGFCVNSGGWAGGNLATWLTKGVQEVGATLWRVIIEETAYEETNDDGSASTQNWTAYDAIYSNSQFSDLWSTIEHLNKQGITNEIILSFMGKTADRLGGTSLSAGQVSEWAEQCATAAYYGLVRRNPPVQFGYFSPSNEHTVDIYEGPLMSNSFYADAMDAVATRLDALGLSSLKLMGPDDLTGNAATSIDEMATRTTLMNHVTHFCCHDYFDGVGTVPARAAAAGKPWFMSELGTADQALTALVAGSSGTTLFEYCDSVYNHAIRRGSGTTPPNDQFAQFPVPVSFNGTTYGVRDPEFYDWQHVCFGVVPGSVFLGSTTSGNVTTYAYRHAASNRTTVMGKNTGAQILLRLTLASLSAPHYLAYYVTTSSLKFAHQSDVAVINGLAQIVLPANCSFTLTGN